jgi:hypothetical protein
MVGQIYLLHFQLQSFLVSSMGNQSKHLKYTRTYECRFLFLPLFLSISIYVSSTGYYLKVHNVIKLNMDGELVPKMVC